MQIEIKILSREEIIKEIGEMTERVANAPKLGLRGRRYSILITPELFPKIFSHKRIELLMELKRTRVKNISELAERLQRPFEVVHRDLKFLAAHGLVRLKKRQQSVVPTLAGEIRMSMAAAA
jgi:hypothetical protein